MYSVRIQSTKLNLVNDDESEILGTVYEYNYSYENKFANFVYNPMDKTFSGVEDTYEEVYYKNSPNNWISIKLSEPEQLFSTIRKFLESRNYDNDTIDKFERVFIIERPEYIPSPIQLFHQE